MQTPAGKTNNAPRPGEAASRAAVCTRAAHTLPRATPARARAYVCALIGPGRSGEPADRDRAYASEIALNGRTKALNNAAIISDGVLSIRARLFNILSHGGPERLAIVGYTDICVPNACTRVNIDDAFN